MAVNVYDSLTGASLPSCKRFHGVSPVIFRLSIGNIRPDMTDIEMRQLEVIAVSESNSAWP